MEEEQKLREMNIPNKLVWFILGIGIFSFLLGIYFGHSLF
jgi:hypothetical protein